MAHIYDQRLYFFSLFLPFPPHTIHGTPNDRWSEKGIESLHDLIWVSISYAVDVGTGLPIWLQKEE